VFDVGGAAVVTGFEARIGSEGVLWLRGELDLATAEDLTAAASAALDGHQRFVLDLSEMTFLDSSGVRAIVKIARTTPQGVVLRNASARIRKVLALTGIEGRAGIELEG
jgi:anti-sigma B factor antagonist